MKNDLTNDNIIEMLDNFNLPDIYHTRISLIKGEQYRLSKNFKADYGYNKKNWSIISGNYLENDLNKINPYAITFTNKEFKELNKLFKRIIK